MWALFTCIDFPIYYLNCSCFTKNNMSLNNCCWPLSLFLVSSYTASFVLLLSMQEFVKRQSFQDQQSRQSSLRLKWGCWMEDEGSTMYFRKNPLRASMNTCLPSSLICVTGESYIRGGLDYSNFASLYFVFLIFHLCHITFYFSHFNLYIKWIMFPPLCLSVRESEDTALLLLKEIYDKQGVAFEQPQQ